MAKDHFQTHYYQKDRVDWNFNVLFRNQADVVRMAREYAPLLKHRGLYDPVPPKWLHSTILRVGLVDDFSEEEMQKVADILTLKLASLQLPLFVFDSWWQWSGNVLMPIAPSDKYTPIYDAVIESLEQVVGEKRTLKSPYGHLIPHVTLAYTKTHNDEVAINRQLSSKLIIPATFNVKSVALIKQWPTNGHYEWEIVREIGVGSSIE